MAADDQQPSTNWALRRTKFAVAALVLALGVIGRHIEAWPVANWPVYSLKRPAVPGPTVSVVELRVEDTAGRWHVLQSFDLFAIDRAKVVEHVIEESLSSDAVSSAMNRRYLLQLVGQELPSIDVRRVDVWQVSWHVRPRSVPPLDHSKPFRERRIGSFNNSDSEQDVAAP